MDFQNTDITLGTYSADQVKTINIVDFKFKGQKLMIIPGHSSTLLERNEMS